MAWTFGNVEDEAGNVFGIWCKCPLDALVEGYIIFLGESDIMNMTQHRNDKKTNKILKERKIHE